MQRCATTDAQSRSKAYQRRWAILVVLCVSLLVIVLDNSILNVAIPTLIRELERDEQPGAVDGRLATRWCSPACCSRWARWATGTGAGARSKSGYLIFGLGSLASAFATTADQLIATRAFMGIGGALIMPATLSIITNVFPPQERGRAIGVWAGTAGIGVALGPLTGGFLLEHFYWGSIFLVNLPIVVFGVIAGFVLIPTSKDPSAPQARPGRRGALDRGVDDDRLRTHRGARTRLDRAAHAGDVRRRDRAARDLRVVGAHAPITRCST